MAFPPFFPGMSVVQSCRWGVCATQNGVHHEKVAFGINQLTMGGTLQRQQDRSVLPVSRTPAEADADKADKGKLPRRPNEATATKNLGELARSLQVEGEATAAPAGAGDAPLSDVGLVAGRGAFGAKSVLRPTEQDLKDAEEDSRLEELLREREDEEAFVPEGFAREQMEAVILDLEALRDSNMLSLAHVEDSYLTFQQETRDKYETYVAELKGKSLTCIDMYKKALRRTQEKLQEASKPKPAPSPKVKVEVEVKVKAKTKTKTNTKDTAKAEAEAELSKAPNAEERTAPAQVDSGLVEALKRLATVNPAALEEFLQVEEALGEAKALRAESSAAVEGSAAVEVLERIQRLEATRARLLTTKPVPALSPTPTSTSTATEAVREIAPKAKAETKLVAVPVEGAAGKGVPVEGAVEGVADKGQEEEQKAEEYKPGTKTETKEAEKVEAEATEAEAANEKAKMSETERGDEALPVPAPAQEEEAKNGAEAETKEDGKEEGPEGGAEEGTEGKGKEATSKASLEQIREQERKIESLQSNLDDKEAELEDLRQQQQHSADSNDSMGGKKAAAGSSDSGSSAATKRYMEKMKAAEKASKESDKLLREAKGKVVRLEKQMEKLEKTAAASGGSGGSGAGGAEAVKLKRELEDLRKKHKKQADEAEKVARKATGALEAKLQGAEKGAGEAQAALAAATEELGALRERAKALGAMEEEHAALQAKAAELDLVRESMQGMSQERDEMEALYKTEMLKRKEYWNMMEDMKGKIRVFARCRPMAKYELERDCKQVVSFPDEFSLDIETQKGPKQFVYDRVFPPQSTQDEIFEDTRNLIQSSLDGYNVCVFAYGQTGSGKTWTMVGDEANPGVVRQSVREVFRRKEATVGKSRLVVKLYMLELYLDKLIDLIYQVKKKADKKSVPDVPPKLDVKKDSKGTVVIKGAQLITVETEAELIGYFEKANAARHVASTNMNAGSSRSHLIFSVLLENTDLASKKTSVGKLSLVDLAGSERQDKTGATDDRLKEAMSINKSLSALGDVISCLSTGEKFIPYRNNVLTTVMQDSLGGNAKTMMIVNFSPADYNSEETASSLTYASRVKQIKNVADRSQEDEQVTLLKRALKDLKAKGITSELLEELEL